MQERSVRLVILLALACVLALNISANGQTESARSEVPKLPRPTGSFGVGRVAFDWRCRANLARQLRASI
jgi:hypothetical protein